MCCANVINVPVLLVFIKHLPQSWTRRLINMTVHIWQWVVFSCLLYQSLQVLCFYRVLRRPDYQSSITPPIRMQRTLIQALYAFQTSPHLSSYSFALAFVRCASQSCSEILWGRGSGVKYDSSHALKQESYSAFKGVHSLLRLCDICLRRSYGRV